MKTELTWNQKLELAAYRPGQIQNAELRRRLAELEQRSALVLAKIEKNLEKPKPRLP